MYVELYEEGYEPKPEKRFEKAYDDGYAVYDNETRLLYHTESDYVAVRLAELMNEQDEKIKGLEEHIHKLTNMLVEQNNIIHNAPIEEIMEIRDNWEAYKKKKGWDK